jgi:formiminotetrahydrofolate cyclodeaminase
MPDDVHLSQETSLAEWLDRLAEAKPSPAGGSAAAIAGALAAALAAMVAGITRHGKRYAAVHARAADVLEQAQALRARMAALAVRDAEEFGRFWSARGDARAEALRQAAVAQEEVLRGAATAADLAVTMADVGAVGALGDAATGTFLAAAAARSAYWAMRADLGAPDAGGAAMLASGLELVERAEAAEWRVRQILSERIP